MLRRAFFVLAESLAADFLGNLLVVGLFCLGSLALGSALLINISRPASWVGPVGVGVSAGFVGSHFDGVLVAALLGNCAEGR